MHLLERVYDSQDLWTVLIPSIPAPEQRQFALWVNRFTDAQIERAFWRVSKKFNRSTDPVVVHKYVTGLLLNLEREAQAGEISI